MELTVTPYQHFKGGHYLVYGDIKPLDKGFHAANFTFLAKESEHATNVEVIVTREGIFCAPFSNETMTLYFSEATGEWWLRPSEEFHGDKIQEDGAKIKRFLPRAEEVPCTIFVSLQENK